jgi:hypothetical protein
MSYQEFAWYYRNSLRCKYPFEVQGAGYSPGAVQGRILCLLKGCLRLLALRIDDGIYHEGCRILSNKIAILKREEGIGRAPDLSHTSITKGLLFSKVLT